MIQNPYTPKTVYRRPQDNGYGKAFAFGRFEVLRSIPFNSVLDVGSGPCLLHQWLKENNIPAHYEAVDLRTDALALCDCPTHTAIPQDKKYDLVCLFGTVTYNFEFKTEENKQTLLSLLHQSLAVSNKYVLFTVMKRENVSNNALKADRFVYYSKQELEDLLQQLPMKSFDIREETTDPTEWFVWCNVNLLR